MSKLIKIAGVFSSFTVFSHCNQSESSVQKRLTTYDFKFNPPPGTYENRDTLNIAVWVGGLSQDDSLLIDFSPQGSAVEQACGGSNIPTSAKCYKITGTAVDVIVQMYGISHGKGIYGPKKTVRYTLVPPSAVTPPPTGSPAASPTPTPPPPSQTDPTLKTF